ncbi:MAG: hypothetical protein RBS40_08520 [Rhodocyclaceae bacterium]|jgi:hypothetical protein|nr:hypothetical protein [Rhodocyclaceae bacterium]
MKTIASLLTPTLAATLLLGGLSFNAQADGGRRFIRDNPAGGVSAGAARHRSGENGRMAARRVVRTDGEGNGVATSGRAWETTAGGSGARGGVTARSADGSIQHNSGIASSGPKGSLNSQGSLNRDADGNVTQSRTTSATNAATGNSYQGNTSYSQETGLSHSGTCFDASGATIPCPRR